MILYGVWHLGKAESTCTSMLLGELHVNFKQAHELDLDLDDD